MCFLIAVNPSTKADVYAMLTVFFYHLTITTKKYILLLMGVFFSRMEVTTVALIIFFIPRWEGVSKQRMNINGGAT